MFCQRGPRIGTLSSSFAAPRNTIVEGAVRSGNLLDIKVSPEARQKDLVIHAPKSRISGFGGRGRFVEALNCNPASKAWLDEIRGAALSA